MSVKVSSRSAEELAASLADLAACSRISTLAKEFAGEVVASTSFGIQSAVMLKLLSEHGPQIPIIFIDTGYHFPETYQYAVNLTERLGLNLKVYRPEWSPAWQEAVHGKLWQQGEEGQEKYGILNKVEPMSRALRELKATVWLSGLRRKQSSTRLERPFAEQQAKTIKGYPILDWSNEEVESYLNAEDLPRHPLADEYVTMGDWHSTRKRSEAVSDEETRFQGEKYECGLHLNSGVTDFQI